MPADDTASRPLPPWPGELVTVGDSEIFVRTAPPRPGGAAEPAVFVHGFASTAVDWTDLMEELRDVLAGDAIDLPGYGFSPPPPGGDYALDTTARTVARLIESGGRGPVHLFGNSLGSLWRDAERITAPTLLLWGRHDQMVDPRLAVPAGQRIRRSRVALLPDCGHIPQVEKPRETAREFRDLLAGLA